MASNNICNEVLGASRTFLLTPCTVQGMNKYTIGTNTLMWDESSYTIEQLAPTFGQPMGRSSEESNTFRCGESAISLFDFGLLYTSFASMRMAQAELGASVSTEVMQTTTAGIGVTWFGNEGVVYGLRYAILIRLQSADVQKACRFTDVILPNFTDSRKVLMSREQDFLVLELENKEVLCKFSIPVCVRRTYPVLFGGQMPSDIAIVDENDIPFAEDSLLGRVVSSAMESSNIEETLNAYRSKCVIDSVVVRSDLICELKRRFHDQSEFLGSICYTPKDDIALAISFRNNLFVWRPWFIGDATARDTIQMEPNPRFEEFYDVRAECEHIMGYASSVIIAPLTPAELDLDMFNEIRRKFFDLELPRIPLVSAFGKVVIPESTLVRGLQSSTGESLYCIVPVGVIGNNVIVKNASCTCSSIKNTPWRTDEYFYDISEVAK